MDKNTIEKLYALYSESSNKPKALKISSVGGNVNLGLDLGEWILKNKLDVIVGKICASSCANYIFPAGIKKHLHKDSILIWHGNSYQTDIDARIKNKEQYLIDWRNRENKFYNSINVTPKIGVYGHKEFTIWNYLYHYAKDTSGFDYSIADMNKFGITNILLVDEEWDWRKYHETMSVIRVEVELTDL